MVSFEYGVLLFGDSLSTGTFIALSFATITSKESPTFKSQLARGSITDCSEVYHVLLPPAFPGSRKAVKDVSLK